MIGEAEKAFYEENGYLLVKGVFDISEVEAMRAGVEGIVERAIAAKRESNHAWQGDFMPEEQLKRVVLRGFHDVQYHDAAFLRAMVHPRMTAVLSALIGPDVQIHHSKMLVKPPENGAAFPMHQDYPYFPYKRHTMLAASVHLDDADEQNGCLRVIPGSHKQGPLPHVGRHYLDAKQYPIAEGTPCPAEAGDVLFFNYLTIHGSDGNRSDRTRRNVLYQYRSAHDEAADDSHVNWGAGLMVCGKQPDFDRAQPRFTLVAPEQA